MQTATPLIQIAQHAARGRTVDVKHVSIASVGSRDDKRLSVGHEPYVAEKRFVENLVDSVAVVDCALRFAHNARAWSWIGIVRTWRQTS